MKTTASIAIVLLAIIAYLLYAAHDDRTKERQARERKEIMEELAKREAATKSLLGR